MGRGIGTRAGALVDVGAVAGEALEDLLAAELDRARTHYNEVRLHEGIGYVTPNDEHEGRGETIRQARRDGLVVCV